MSMADGTVLPKPGIPKTLGILNVIFGVLLVLYGLCGLTMLALAPMMMQGMGKVVKEAQSKVAAQEKAQSKALDDRLAQAKTDEEKKEIEAEKANLAAQPKAPEVDLTMFTGALEDPTIKAVSLGGAITGLILHVVLLASGIGLIRLTSWGRTLSIWWSALIIVQVLVLMVVTIIYVLPANQKVTEQMFAKLQAANKAQGAAPPAGPPGAPDPAMMAKSMGAIAIPITVAQSMVGLIYPIVLLIMLNQPAARAACLAKKPIDVDDL